MFKGTFFLAKLCWKYSKLSILYLTLKSLVDTIIPFVGIVLPKYIIDELMGKQRIDYLIFYTGALIVTILFGNTLSNFFHTQYFLKKIDVSNKFYISISENLIKADLEQIESPYFLDLKTKAERFLYADGYGFGGVLDKTATIFTQVIILLGIITIISTLSPIVVVIFLILTLLNTYFNSKVKKANIKLDLERPTQERHLGYDMSICENYTYAKEVRVNNLSNWLMERLTLRVKTIKGFYSKSSYNNLKVQIISNISTFCQQIVTYFYLIYNVINHFFSIGTFTMYLNAINTFSGSMYSIMDNIVDLWRFSDYYEAVESYTNIPRKQREGKNDIIKINDNPVIEFKNVSYRYPNQENYVLKNVNIKINQNEKLSIVGENGAGKTTFVKLLLKLYSPSEGQILLNGKDIKDYTFDDYVDAFSVVFQDYCLFSMSLKENVALSRSSEANDKSVEEILMKSGLENKLRELNYNLATNIYKNFDETGFEPSGGEGQKIALARALFKNANFVILDEPTAALDPRAEYELYQQFDELVSGKTAIYISHRLSSTRFCDNIAMFKNGEIVEYGPHDDLIKANGLYTELFKMQAQFYTD